MRRNVYNSPNSPNGNQDPNSNDGGGLPEGWQPRSPSPSDNLPPRLTMEEMREQRAIEEQIRKKNRERLNQEPSNGQAGGAIESRGEAGAFSRFVRSRIVEDSSVGTRFAGARGNPVIAEQIASQVPLNEIIPSQNNNQINSQTNNANDLPPQGVDQPTLPLVPPENGREQQPFARPRNDVNYNYFQLRFQDLVPQQPNEQQQVLTQQTVQLTPEQQVGEQRRQEAQQRILEAHQIAQECLQRTREAQERVGNLLEELARPDALQRQVPQQRVAEAQQRPAPQPIETQVEQQAQDGRNTPETYLIRPVVDRSYLPDRQPGGENGEKSPQR